MLVAHYASKIVSVRMYARPAEITALIEAIRAEEQVALKDLKVEWTRKEQAERQAAAILCASRKAAMAMVSGPAAETPSRPDSRVRSKPQKHTL